VRTPEIVTCDRCKVVYPGGIEGGCTIRDYGDLGNVDLCRNCYRATRAWIKETSGHED
jgi:hypothetical protein